MTDHIFRCESMTMEDARHLIENGDRLLCPRCKSVLEVAFTLEEADRLDIWPGICCPKNQAHVLIRFEYR